MMPGVTMLETVEGRFGRQTPMMGDVVNPDIAEIAEHQADRQRARIGEADGE